MAIFNITDKILQISTQNKNRNSPPGINESRMEADEIFQEKPIPGGARESLAGMPTPSPNASLE